MSNTVVVLAGPNGAGKTTCAAYLLHEFLDVHEYVNADAIAQEVFGDASMVAHILPGKIMLRRLHRLGEAGADFAFETTLAPRSFAPWLRALTQRGYLFILLYIWLRSPELAVERVLTRAKLGGHHVPASVVRRRYWAGIRNFFRLYRPVAAVWKIYDNSSLSPPRCIAYGHRDRETRVVDSKLWQQFREGNA
jgi:predicted ABC-type ATPase